LNRQSRQPVAVINKKSVSMNLFQNILVQRQVEKRHCEIINR
jgi:hypothetical protein